MSGETLGERDTVTFSRELTVRDGDGREQQVISVYYRIWDNVVPLIVESIGQTFDMAVFHGTNKPDGFPEGIVPGAIAAGNSLVLGANGGLYQDLMGTDGLVEMIEADGYIPTGYVGAVKMRSLLRGALDENGQPLFRPAYREGAGKKTPYELDGEAVLFAENGGVDPGQALLIGGDFKQAVWAVRKDISVKLLSEAAIQDPSTKAIVYNLAQQDMVALRVVFRAGWALPNPVNRINGGNAARYPFAVLCPGE